MGYCVKQELVVHMHEVESAYGGERPEYHEPTQQFKNVHTGNVWMSVLADPIKKLFTSDVGEVAELNSDTKKDFMKKSVPSGFVVVAVGTAAGGCVTPTPVLLHEVWMEVALDRHSGIKYAKELDYFVFDQLQRSEGVETSYGQPAAPMMTSIILQPQPNFGMLDVVVWNAHLTNDYEDETDRADAEEIFETSVRYYLASLLLAHFRMHNIKGVTYTNVATATTKSFSALSAISTTGAVNVCNITGHHFSFMDEIYVLPPYVPNEPPKTLASFVKISSESKADDGPANAAQAWKKTVNKISEFLPMMCVYGKRGSRVDVPAYYPVPRDMVWQLAKVLPPHEHKELMDRCYLGKCHRTPSDMTNLEVELGIVASP